MAPSPRTSNRTSRWRRRSLLLAAASGAFALAPRTARAQSDVNPPLPDVLILLDTSGSMERMADGTMPSISVGGTSSTIKNRWVTAIETLGGSINGYQLLAVDRSTSDFNGEYGLQGTAPYDASYYLPHYRPISNSCTIGASSLTATKNWTTGVEAWGVSDFGFRSLSGSTLGAVGSCNSTNWTTDGLGLLQTFRDQARFALMTFDNATDAHTGWSSSGGYNGAQGILGNWSYFPGYDGATGGTPAHGWPNSCAVDPTNIDTSHTFEVGARNPYAPAWEGPMVRFAANDSTTELERVNARIQYAVSAARPYGATPVGPMFADAAYYWLNDPSGPNGTTSTGAPVDANIGCRGKFIILITDGFPNEDLRPSCQNSGSPTVGIWGQDCASAPTSVGCCPALRPQDTAYNLYHSSDPKKSIQTFVVGFALSDNSTPPNPVDCSTVDPSTSICTTMAATDPRQPCCTLHQIAYNGGTNRAQIATDADSLRAALRTAMASVTAASSTSRTVPVFTSISTGSSGNQTQAEFRSSFKVSAFQAWSGILERVRWTCQSGAGGLVATPQSFDASKGDDFAADLNSSVSTRTIISGDATVKGYTSSQSLRPKLAATDNDGVGLSNISMFQQAATSVQSYVSPAAMNIASTTCSDTTSTSLCESKYLNYALGLPQPTTKYMDRVGNAFGDIYHATPVTVGPPSGFPRDESYTAFKTAQASRTPFVLTATNDGLLHAFDTTVSTQTENELWGFIPPAVLPQLGKQYGGNHVLLLDAAPVVADVPFGAAGSSTPYGRSRTDAQGGNATWRTVAVGGLTAGGGYYALDITDPKNPQFLWQLTNFGGASGAPLFGQTPAQPSIGIVYYSEGSANPVETPVAFLPGGSGTIWNSSGLCNRWQTNSATDPKIQWRSQTRCWSGPGQSMTVVRLYDGKILRSFRNDPAGAVPNHNPEPSGAAAAFVAAGYPTVVKDSTGSFAKIDSPITGQLSLYPAGIGAVTTRGFVGDADGALWRLDVSAQQPNQWTFSLFHDAYYPSDSDNASSTAWAPVATPPSVSTDRFGNIVVDYATGDQSNFASTYLNYVFSVSENVTKTAGVTTLGNPSVNWRMKLPAGITPTGPLNLFNGTLYFSTFSPGVPDSANTCLSGQGTLWAVDYLQADSNFLPLAGFVRQPATDDTTNYTGTCPGTSAPWSVLSEADTTGSTNYRCIRLPAGTIVYGLGLTQRPSCSGTSTVGSDPYFGNSITNVASVSPGAFQLVAQTGPSKVTGPVTTTATSTNTYTYNLKAPLPLTKVDSWASVVE
jgi:type IV pilus assembly protein PilY1